MIKEIKNISEYNWIEEGLEKWPENPTKDGFRIWHAIPKGFPAYCKILPPIYLDLDYSQDSRTWADIKRQSKDEFLLSNRLTFPKPNFKAQRILWKELAKLHKTPFTAQISDHHLWSYSWPIRYVSGGAEGEIAPEVAIRLSELLSTTISGEYFFSYFDGAVWNDCIRRIFKSSISSGIHILQMSEMLPGTQAYWWGIKRDWCLVVDYDSDFSFFGGSEDLIDQLSRDSIIECIRVEIDTRL